MRVNKLSGIIMRVTAVLICLVLFSAHLASGMFARYTSGASGGGSARVARFGVEVKEATALTIDDSGNGSYQFYVVNKDTSEVPFQYDIVVRINATDPEGIFRASEIASALSDVKLNGYDSLMGEYVTYDGTYSESDNSYTFSVEDRCLNSLGPGMDSEVYTFTFKKSDLVKVNVDAAAQVTETSIPIELDVSAKGTQVN